MCGRFREAEIILKSIKTSELPRDLLINYYPVSYTHLDSNGPESLYFFKTSVEPHIGEVSYFKVMSGKVHEGDDLLNADRGSKAVSYTHLSSR